MKSWCDSPIKKININDRDFPKTLKKIKKCPSDLYYRGYWDKTIFDKTISIVGSRRMTKYGAEVIGRILPDLIGAKTMIISGFMYGVDTETHRQTIAMGGKTIAVLGNGLNYLYPLENDKLYSEIVNSGGLVISEYEPETKPTLWSFPQRNRIVSGLSTLGIIVIEAAINSGSLITAKFGRIQGKEVFAVPGPITASTSKGTNWLIQQGLAKLVTESSEILETGKKPKTDQISLWDNLEDEEIKTMKLLEAENMDIDEISKSLKKSVMETGAMLSLMCLKGYIKESLGQYQIKK